MLDGKHDRIKLMLTAFVWGYNVAAARDFSKRHGFRTRPMEMRRAEAPPALRSFVLRHVSDSARTSIHHARDLVSHTLKYIPNPANQSIDEIWKEIQQAIESCDWFLVYDLIEELYRDRQWSKDEQDGFLKEVNEFFYDQNLGWQLRTVPIEDINLVVPEIGIRGSEAFEMAVTGALDSLESSGPSTGKKDHHGALQDHPGTTLDQTVKRHPERFPAPLGDAVSKLDKRRRTSAPFSGVFCA